MDTASWFWLPASSSPRVVCFLEWRGGGGRYGTTEEGSRFSCPPSLLLSLSLHAAVTLAAGLCKGCACIELAAVVVVVCWTTDCESVERQFVSEVRARERGREGGEPPFISLSLTALRDRRSLSHSLTPATTLSNKWLPKSGSTMFTCLARARAAFKFSRVNPVPPPSTLSTVNEFQCQQKPKRRNA